MRRYELASGIVFTIIAAGQLTRLLLKWPVQVSNFTVPLWASVIACLVAATFAIWAFRTLKGTS
ncbi:MAG TPA: hypothetical protein VLB12_15535 [Gemmatimonadales bacterium]|nr:hypothetical protein [Gemmatimonadales bacterium]